MSAETGAGAARAVLDLGAIDAPVLVYGGPYSNLQATQALFDRADALGIAPEHRINTGDIVAYCAAPEATTRAVTTRGGPVVRGNCEESFGAGAEDCGCGFEEGSACDLLARGWFAHAMAELSPDSRAVMAACPAEIRFSMAGLRLSAVHGGFSAINRFIFPIDQAAMADECARTGADIVLAGHSGVPLAQQVNQQWWLNAGVIGMPANDGDPRTWFMVLTPDATGLEVVFHRLGYDHAAAAAEMRRLGLAEGYARALETGLWPNMDVMPDADRDRCGQPIPLSRLHIERAAARAA
ncbi:MAG: metallophosphoesterase family protein [Minwuia sp.]|nr:metallophosphoesterase family protein [Minwuia sp.]